MTISDRETDELLADMPLPSDPKTILLGGLFALALLTTAYVASEIVLPMVFAFILKLLLQPIFRFLERPAYSQSASGAAAHLSAVWRYRRLWHRDIGACW
jgi:predicted PurR-regulated permease PerM